MFCNPYERFKWKKNVLENSYENLITEKLFLEPKKSHEI